MNLRTKFLTAWLSCTAVFSITFAEDGPAITEVAKAGPIYAIQGEYVGDVGGQKWGAQVIALNDKEIESVGLGGGLPGDGWQRGGELRRGKGSLIDGTGELEGDEWEATIKNGVLTVFDLDGNELAKLKKVERKSPTLGAKPPAGAIVLFDGTNTDEWENAKIIEGNLLGATNCTTKRKFNDHTLHIEFRTPFMASARGQGRGNSGVYLQGRYECQVLDSFGLDGKDNECGGIYSINQPKVNMCYPPLTWQTYDIDFKAAKYDADGKKTTNARATIRHNGFVIHDNLELVHGTPGHSAEGPGPEHLFLQDHGNPVAFRNIWIVEK